MVLLISLNMIMGSFSLPLGIAGSIPFAAAGGVSLVATGNKTTSQGTAGDVAAGTTTNTTATAVGSNDSRVRIRPFNSDIVRNQVYGPEDPTNLLHILRDTNGLMFPYTPSISISQATEYRSVDLVHSIGDIAAYVRTPAPTLGITGTFTIQNQREGQYALAVLHFLRTMSKMYFGESARDTATKTGTGVDKTGLPPPVLVLQGYGDYILDNIPVIIKSHSYTFDKAANMVTFQNQRNTTTQMPDMFDIQVDLLVQQTPTHMRKTFDLDKFRTGELLATSGKTGWI